MLIIPNNRLNGYNIIAQAPTRTPENAGPVYCLLGHDPSRQYPKYVTALANKRSVEEYREWFWGHYFEHGDDAFTLALADWIKRLNLGTEGIDNIAETLGLVTR